MSGCRTIVFFYKVLPLKLWRGFLIRCHIEKCAACETRLVHKEEIRTRLLKEEEVGDSGRLWSGVRAELKIAAEKESPPQSSTRARWRWVLGAAGLMIAVLTGIWLYRGHKSDGILPGKEMGRKFQIQYMRIGEEPARPFVYQPQDSKIIIIWAERTLSGG
jgi:hypothetical protein